MEDVLELLGVISTFNSFGFFISVAMYVLGCLGLYTIAKRRMLKNPWLAWLPVGYSWILGSISDQYQISVKQNKTTRRKILLGLEIAVIGCLLAMIVGAVIMVVNLVAQSGMNSSIVYDPSYDMVNDARITAAAIGVVSVVLIMFLIVCAVGIVYTVFTYICYYDLYRSSDPSNATLYLVLSIFFNFLGVIFVFVCKDKDDGMRPPEDYRRYSPQNGYQPPSDYQPQEDYRSVQSGYTQSEDDVMQ